MNMEHGRHTSDSSYKTPNLLYARLANVLFSKAWKKAAHFLPFLSVLCTHLTLLSSGKSWRQQLLFQHSIEGNKGQTVVMITCS